MRWLLAGSIVLAALAALDGFEALRTLAFQLGRHDTPQPLWNASVRQPFPRGPQHPAGPRVAIFVIL